ncbi:porphobilinogen synthase [Humidisolicoccus flavus]|uniref:porphobilinogen synthase n=1 Tax=Humidisolicoccus flavus TaxID=3111414 RepID=UPI0032526AFA
MSSPSLPPVLRPRRLRQNPVVRRFAQETSVAPNNLVLPMFLADGIDAPRAIASMPGVVQHTMESLIEAASGAADRGVAGVMLFGVPRPEDKDASGSHASAPDGILTRGIAALAEALGDRISIQADLCLDEFTDHGHCGVLDPSGAIDNDATLERYEAMAITLAEAGAEVLGLSGMMDGQTGSIRFALDERGLTDVILLAYSAKYASAFYGPFRDAVGSSLQGDRRTYQLDPANAREGVREAELDVAEGADIVMVKPAGHYLDVLQTIRQESPVPVWAYQVSGEYAMIEAAAAQGWIDRERAILESVTAIRRAGADVVLTYWASEIAQLLNDQTPRSR